MNILQNKYFIISFFLLLIYLLPLIVFGQDSYILIHDNLDSNVVWFKILAHSGKIFADNSVIIPNFMNIPRGSLGNEFNLILWLYYFFEPYTAYVINEILMRIIAFIGMYLLLSNYIFKNEKYQKYSFLLSGLFSILPFWPSGGLSVAGLPLITYVFLNIRKNIETKKDWIILVLFPFYSDFVLSMMFYIIIVGFVWAYDIVKKQITWKFTIALFLFGLIYLLINYRLLEVFLLHDGFVSHRIEFQKDYYGLFEAFRRTISHFLFGQYHAYSLQFFFLPFVGIIFLINLFSKNKSKLIIGLFILNIFISILYGFDKYKGIQFIRDNIHILKELQLRFYFMFALSWYILFALSIKYYFENIKNFRYKEIIVYIIIGLSIFYSFKKSDFVHEYRNSNITYKQYFATSLFNKIKKYIGKNPKDYKIASIGIHPAISQYNGFYTLDGYSSNYPLKYKHQFRKIISKELNKDKSLKKGFDDWGSRCYIFIHDVGYNYIRNKDKVYPINIDLNSREFYNLGGRYIFSSYPIDNSFENNITFIKKFEDNDSAWDIYLYEVNM